MEIVDPVTGTTPEWEAFIASLDPKRLERERFGKPGPSERFGSPGWRRMAAEHHERVEAFYGRLPEIHEWELEAILAEAREYDQRFTRTLTPEHYKIAERALRHTEGHAA